MTNKLSDLAVFREERISVNTLNDLSYISVDNMIPNCGGIKKSEYVPSSGTTRLFKKGDILIGNIRPYFKKIWLAEFDGGCSTDVLVLQPKEGIDARLLYSVLCFDHFFEYDMAGSKGSKMPRGDKIHIMNYPISVKFNSNNSIGNLIYSINKKIMLNQRICDLVDRYINELYKYWFIQFDFPKNGHPYKTNGGKMKMSEKLKIMIPNEWSDAVLYNNSLCSVIKPGINKFVSKKNYLATANVEFSNITDGEWITFDNRENRANMQPIINSLWAAKMKDSIKHIFITSQDEWIVDKYILSTGFLGFKTNEMNLPYLYAYLNYPLFESIKNQVAHGATQKSINNDDLTSFPIVIPPNEILNEFNEVVLPLMIKSNYCRKNILFLESIKNFLFPFILDNQIKI